MLGGMAMIFGRSAAVLAGVVLAVTVTGPAVAAPVLPPNTLVRATWVAEARTDRTITDLRPYWSVVAVQPSAPGDYDLQLLDANATTVYSRSVGRDDRLDFIAMNNVSGAAAGPHTVRVQRYRQGPGGTATEYWVQFADEGRMLTTGAAPVALPFTGKVLVRDVYLPAGRKATFTFGSGAPGICPTPMPGNEPSYDLAGHAFLMGSDLAADPSSRFRNLDQAVASRHYTVARGNCQVSFAYTPVRAGWFGLVVVNVGKLATTPPLAVKVAAAAGAGPAPAPGPVPAPPA